METVILGAAAVLCLSTAVSCYFYLKHLQAWHFHLIAWSQYLQIQGDEFLKKSKEFFNK